MSGSGTTPLASSQHQNQASAQQQNPASSQKPNSLSLKREALESPSERAKKHLKPNQPGNRLKHLKRVALDDIGFDPDNRGGAGLITHHMHAHVLPDVIKHGTSPNRYCPMRLVEVPAEHLETWRDANRIKCENDPLMPKFSPTMWLKCLTKTHFGHVQKLCKDGGRSQFNEGKLPAKLNDDDEEGHMVQKVGVLAVVYGPELWNDPAAMRALMHEDNLDANCRLGESELKVFRRVHMMGETMRASSQQSGNGDLRATVEEVTTASSSGFQP